MPKRRLWLPSNVQSWLQGDIQSPEIDFRFAPNIGRGSSGPRETVVEHSGCFGWIFETGYAVRAYTHQMAEVAVPKALFTEILRLIDELRPVPSCKMPCGKPADEL